MRSLIAPARQVDTRSASTSYDTRAASSPPPPVFRI